LFVDSTAGQPVTILGADGEPFARIGPDGTEVNVHSPVYAADLQARGQAPSEDVDPSSPPEWRQTSKSPKMGWLDLRARPATLEPADPGRRTVLADWTIPVEAAGQRAEIRGVTTYVPLHETAGGLAVVWIVIVGALIGVGLGISARLLTLRYRRPTAR
jgi:hypothetical protein